ncbi:phosphatidylinositide phosphatase SAC1, partial [Exaiptasia diaphana]|uniref:Phosphatidylinositol-3-phosphatase SAC1 n=1 Tax=Exaiptasia diaphana TaxID=2652724 RepID=A0A913YER6_EXADI
MFLSHLSSFCLQIDQKGAEKILGDNFYTILRNSGYKEDKLRYDAFDFHKECSKMRWDRLNILIDRQNSDLKKFGYFSMDKDRAINSEQKGIFRTNCIDSLDRTNVVQSMLASKSLEFQLEVIVN